MYQDDNDSRYHNGIGISPKIEIWVSIFLRFIPVSIWPNTSTNTESVNTVWHGPFMCRRVASTKLCMGNAVLPQIPHCPWNAFRCRGPVLAQLAERLWSGSGPAGSRCRCRVRDRTTGLGCGV